MKLITKNTDYAVRALVYLAEHPGAVVSAREISKEEGIPERFLKRLLSELKKNDYILSKEGKGGGVTLYRDPRSIFVSEVIELFQGDFRVSACMFRKALCPNRRSCVLRAKMKVIEADVEKKFGKISIYSLMNERS